MLSIAELSSFNEDHELKENLAGLAILGGIDALEKGLRTDFKRGLKTVGSESDIEERIKLYGRNEFPDPEFKSWFGLFIESFEDATLIVLIAAAVISFIVGLIDDPSTGWIEGAAILFAVLLVAAVTATNNFNKETQFRKLNKVKDDTEIGIIRDGVVSSIDIKKVVVGDILLLNAGDRVPADGVLVEGSDVSCNESALTGESDDLRKETSGDLFLLSGSSVATGYAHMLVTSVGEQSRWGKTKAKLATESADTPLQEKLDILAGQIGNLGIASAVATFIAMSVLWYLYPERREDAGETLFEFLLRAFIICVTIVVVAVPEGLPLAVTLSLAYSTQKMMLDNNLIRVLAACETMGNATNICSDKTGTLTQNRMTVVEAWIGGISYSTAPSAEDLHPSIVQLIADGVAINSTANLLKGGEDGPPIVTGSKTEGALLSMLESSFNIDYIPLRSKFDASRGDRLFTFTSSRKRMSVVMVTGISRGKKTGICYTKGASEIILDCCDKYLDKDGSEKELTSHVRAQLLRSIEKMAKGALRTIAIAHKSVLNLKAEDSVEELETCLTLDAIYGIKDPLRPDVKQAVAQCQRAGIFVRMVTGDNIDTAKAIATECGILTEGGLCLEGPTFRKLTPAQLDALLPTLQVLARSSPADKHTLVTRLNGAALPTDKESWLVDHPGQDWDTERDLLLPGYHEEWTKAREQSGGVGEVVGVTGDGTNDGPALKAADVGLSMGLSGTDVAKESSDIVILDDNFSSIVKSVMWGRSVFDNIRKFLQFQLTVNVVALTITFVSAVTGKEPPLNAVMMLWVNLIMDTMGALALGTEPPSATLLERRPYKRNASLVSNKMLRHIIIQFLFQFALLSYLLIMGVQHFQVISNSKEHTTIIFNTFVLCQVFNEINARSIDDTLNVFKNLHLSPLFISIIIFTVLAQYGIVEYGGGFVRTVGLTSDQWLKCILLSSLTLPIGGLMRLVPIADNESDYAESSKLISFNQSDDNDSSSSSSSSSSNSSSSSSIDNKAKSNNNNQQFDLSFLIWLIVVSVIPVLVLQHFNDQWKLL